MASASVTRTSSSSAGSSSGAASATEAPAAAVVRMLCGTPGGTATRVARAAVTTSPTNPPSAHTESRVNSPSALASPMAVTSSASHPTAVTAAMPAAAPATPSAWASATAPPRTSRTTASRSTGSPQVSPADETSATRALMTATTSAPVNGPAGVRREAQEASTPTATRRRPQASRKALSDGVPNQPADSAPARSSTSSPMLTSPRASTAPRKPRRADHAVRAAIASGEAQQDRGAPAHAEGGPGDDEEHDGGGHQADRAQRQQDLGHRAGTQSRARVTGRPVRRRLTCRWWPGRRFRRPGVPGRRGRRRSSRPRESVRHRAALCLVAFGGRAASGDAALPSRRCCMRASNRSAVVRAVKSSCARSSERSRPQVGQLRAPGTRRPAHPGQTFGSAYRVMSPMEPQFAPRGGVAGRFRPDCPQVVTERPTRDVTRVRANVTRVRRDVTRVRPRRHAGTAETSFRHAAYRSDVSRVLARRFARTAVPSRPYRSDVSRGGDATQPQVRGTCGCVVPGCGQGRGRTADLPIFSRSLVPTELPGRAVEDATRRPGSAPNQFALRRRGRPRRRPGAGGGRARRPPPGGRC